MICARAIDENHGCYAETKNLTKKIALYKTRNGDQSSINSSCRCHKAKQVCPEGKNSFSLSNSEENLELQTLNSTTQQTNC